VTYTISTHNNYLIDLMMVRDKNRVVSMVGAAGSQVVPHPGERVLAEDEDGNIYDARVESGNDDPPRVTCKNLRSRDVADPKVRVGI
jgi:hypothetical protein